MQYDIYLDSDMIHISMLVIYHYPDEYPDMIHLDMDHASSLSHYSLSHTKDI